MNNVTEIVTNKILAEMEKGVVPWERPWIVIPKQNMVSKKPYGGINRLLLAFENEDYYLSFNQVKQLGGKIKKGAKAQIVIFWKPIEKHKADAENKKPEEKPEYFVLLRYYRVFKLADTEGISRPEKLNNNPRREDIEAFIQRINPKIEFGGSTASYNPESDTINMPVIERFNDSDHYYATFMHELLHWTGSKGRLDRFNGDGISNYHQSYGKEELVAEIGSAILCHYFGISLPAHNAAYLDNWVKAIKGDNRMLLGASARAEKALEFLKLEV
ncbi:MAG: hypothetical protein A2252_09160 [Elusimicrobia bacterium RIFOXYA2_FULL_39_19]|nr:MAG: hypothetical protein A2252_09160 [Elusimicrobia bacterium RIFOXYA2_FULL_39_19]